MSGIRQDYGAQILESLTCSTDDLWINSKSSATIYSLVGTKVSGALSTNWSEYTRGTDNWKLIESETITSAKTWTATINAETPAVTSSYIGLLTAPPQYYMGPTSVNGVNNLHPCQDVYALEDGAATSTHARKAFLDVKEIPNISHNGFLTEDPVTPSETKPFNGMYWSGYERKKLGEVEQSSSGMYSVKDSAMTGAAIELSQTWNVGTTNTVDNTYALVNSNSLPLFMGENDTTYNWPAVKYFGLFRNATNNTKIWADYAHTNTFYFIEDSQDLYMWGELTENNNWYHAWTGDATTFAAEKDHLYENTGTSAAPVYELTEDTSYVSTKTYYEKTGIIVEPEQGAIFSKGMFKLQFEDTTWIKGV